MSESKTITYEWNQIPWRKLEVSVFKLQRRIYKASQAGDVKKVHKLQRLLLKSRAARLLAVRRVTQENQGKKTAGIDGVKSLTPRKRLTLAANLEKLPMGSPTRRIWIPKPGKNEKRPLSIPTIYDRAQQAHVKLALEPEWEAKFEPNSYGFRPGRSTHDAIEAIFKSLREQSKYVLDADIAKCFDRIDHNVLLKKINTFPKMNRIIKKWLKAGALDNGVFIETERGTQQGSIVSPILANIALHGLESHIRNHYPVTVPAPETTNQKTLNWKPQIIRYADDLVVLHRDRDVIEECREIMQEWLSNVGLELNEKKTRITHTLEDEGAKPGFDFLGFNIRQYKVSKYKSSNGRGFKTLIKPSRDSIKSHNEKLAKIIRKNRSAEQSNLIKLLNPVIIGWANYHSAAVSKRTFNLLDSLVYEKLRRWTFFRHPNKSRHWITRRYWKTNSSKSWIFSSQEGPHLNLHSNTPIVRHIKVKGTASPFDGNWKYWATRRGQYP
ncbi:MAG: group II intron reverse transcriptase/maturase, partial [Gammaproteobacteria bacterium]|nr:group II intron reverse transcriptase/maturase [Gammaproteobacteria bacterium]